MSARPEPPFAIVGVHLPSRFFHRSCAARDTPAQARSNPVQEIAASTADARLLLEVQHYLTHRTQGLPTGRDLEAAWGVFFARYSQKICKYAVACGAAAADMADCVQDVWTELLVRLPSFRLDPKRGQFDSWLFQIVRGKTVDLVRFHKRSMLQANAVALQLVTDGHPSPAHTLEEQEMVRLAWSLLRQKLSQCSFHVFRLRLVEQRTVAEVAETLGLSHQQVWYRYHRARRLFEDLGSALAGQRRLPRRHDDPPHKRTVKAKESAQGKAVPSVSRSVGSLAGQGEPFTTR